MFSKTTEINKTQVMEITELMRYNESSYFGTSNINIKYLNAIIPTLYDKQNGSSKFKFIEMQVDVNF